MSSQMVGTDNTWRGRSDDSDGQRSNSFRHWKCPCWKPCMCQTPRQTSGKRGRPRQTRSLTGPTVFNVWGPVKIRRVKANPNKQTNKTKMCSVIKKGNKDKTQNKIVTWMVLKRLQISALRIPQRLSWCDHRNEALRCLTLFMVIRGDSYQEILWQLYLFKTKQNTASKGNQHLILS